MQTRYCEHCAQTMPPKQPGAGRPPRFCSKMCANRAGAARRDAEAALPVRTDSTGDVITIDPALPDDPLTRLRWQRDQAERLIAGLEPRNQGAAALLREHREAVAAINELTNAQAPAEVSGVSDLAARREARRAARANS
jgi:hypothetical protein